MLHATTSFPNYLQIISSCFTLIEVPVEKKLLKIIAKELCSVSFATIYAG